MKKKLLIALCTLTLMFAVPVTASAAVSPSGTPDNSTTTGTDKAPATGESDAIIYGILAAAGCGAVAAVAKKRVDATR